MISNAVDYPLPVYTENRVPSVAVLVRFEILMTGVDRIAFRKNTRFQFSPDDQRKQVCRRTRQQRDKPLIIPNTTRHTARQPGVTVWAAISFNNSTPLVVIHGTITIQVVLRLYSRAHCLPFLSWHYVIAFQQDNAQLNTENISPVVLSNRSLSN